MNPPDENQTASTRRPPFMSAGRRPAAGEDNILARLERDARRGQSGMRWKQSWIAWCSVASLAIIGLIGVLASLARENIEVHAPLVAVADTKSAPDPYAAPANTGLAPLPALVTVPKQPATIVDARPERTERTERTERPERLAAARPAMVTLKPDPVRAKAAPARTVAAAARKTAPAHAAKAPPRPVVAAAARPKKAAPAPVAAPEPAVDSDVALLSAIILHANRHAGERAQIEAARCGAGKKCAPAPDPLTSLKATD